MPFQYTSAQEYLWALDTVLPKGSAKNKSTVEGLIQTELMHQLYHLLKQIVLHCVERLARQDVDDSEKMGAIRTISSGMKNAAVVRTLQELGALPVLQHMALHVTEAHYVQEIFWILAKGGGPEALYGYITAETRPFALTKAYWVMGYQDVLESSSEEIIYGVIAQMTRCLEEMPEVVDGAPEFHFHVMRLLGNALGCVRDNGIGIDDAIKLLKGLQRRISTLANDAQRWTHWLWTASALARKAQNPAANETWRTLFAQIPLQSQLRWFWNNEDVVKETVEACFAGMLREDYLNEITSWTEYFPHSFCAVKRALSKLVEYGDLVTPSQALKTLRVIIPRAANIEARLERETVLEAAMILGAAAFDSAAVNKDAKNAEECCMMLLESIEKFMHYRRLVIICIDGLRSVILRCPKLVSFVMPYLKERIIQICHIHRGDEPVLKSAFFLVFSTDDFEYMISLLEVTGTDDNAVTKGMEVATTSLQDGTCADWQQERYRKLGNVAKMRLFDLRDRMSYRRPQAYCVQVLALCVEHAPELIQEDTLKLLIGTFCDLWSDPGLAYYVLTGTNKVLAFITRDQRLSLPINSFLVCVQQALQWDDLHPGYAEQLRFAKLLLQGVDACFDTADKYWDVQRAAISATELFLRSVREEPPQEFLSTLKSAVERAAGNDYEYAETDVADKFRVVLGLLHHVSSE